MVKLEIAGFEDHAFIPVLPTAPSNETLEFLTTILTSHDGTEDVKANRFTPRQNFSYSFRADSLERQQVLNHINENIRGKWAVPQWQQAYYVGSVEAGLQIEIINKSTEFVAGQLVLVYTDEKTYQLAKIAEVGVRSLILETPIVDQLNCFICPVSSGLIKGNVSTISQAGASKLKVEYEISKPHKPVTNIGVLFSINMTDNFEDETGEDLRRELLSCIEFIKNYIENFNCSFTVGFSFFAGGAPIIFRNLDFPILTRDNIQDAIDFVNTQPTYILQAVQPGFQYGIDWFENRFPNNGDRKDFWFFISEGALGINNSFAENSDIHNRTGPFLPPTDVDIICASFDFYNNVVYRLIDNVTEIDDWPIVNAENPNAFSDRFKFHLSGELGLQIDGIEVLQLRPENGESVSKSISKIEDRVDFGVGAFEVRSPWKFARQLYQHRFVFEDEAEQFLFKRFFARRHGRAHTFFMPTFDSDIKVKSISNDGLSLFSDNEGLHEFSDLRRFICAVDLSGKVHPLQIQSLQNTLLGGVEIRLVSPLTVAYEEIELFSFLVKSRFESDKLVFNYQGNYVSETTLGIRGLE